MTRSAEGRHGSRHNCWPGGGRTEEANIELDFSKMQGANRRQQLLLYHPLGFDSRLCSMPVGGRGCALLREWAKLRRCFERTK
jgi:hypothetical protein